MNIKKTKIAFALSGLIFLAMPLPSAFADEKHCDIKETQLGDTMKYMKSELRGYVKGFKGDDAEKMQLHLTELLKLSAMAEKHTPAKIKNMHEHEDMSHDGMAMVGMDHSKMKQDGSVMPEMDHSKMKHDGNAIPEMDHNKMKLDGNVMPEMDHSKMGHADMAMVGMDHSDMDVGSTAHDMSAMPSMPGMTAEQHHQHMMYMQGVEKLQELFKQLANTQDKSEIKTILGNIKEHSKKNHQLFRQNCD